MVRDTLLAIADAVVASTVANARCTFRDGNKYGIAVNKDQVGDLVSITMWKVQGTRHESFLKRVPHLKFITAVVNAAARTVWICDDLYGEDVDYYDVQQYISICKLIDAEQRSRIINGMIRAAEVSCERHILSADTRDRSVAPTL